MRNKLTPMNPRHVPCLMLSGTRLRILAHLSKYDGNFDDKWNIPREQSLPGIAEALGVVRSAVHNPLATLEKDKLIISKNAQVIGKDSRRRKVIHITHLGLETLSEADFPEKIKKFKYFGPIPNLINLHGRNTEVLDISNILKRNKNILLNGLPGIGKSSLARAIAEKMMEEGWTLRWASCDNDTDISAIAKMWLNQSGMYSSKAISAAVDYPRNLLIIDEIQELNNRHINSINQLISDIATTKASILIIVRAPSPFDNLIDFDDIRLEGLPFEGAKKILPSNIDNILATKIIQSLGGHPLALHLWAPNTQLPEENYAVQEYVKSTVIKRLSDEGIKTLDELSLSPLPLSTNELFSSIGTDELDDSAILKWHSKEIELHHLIKYVRRSFFTQEKTQEFHIEMAKKWAKKEGFRAIRMEAHHRLQSGHKIDSDWFISNLPILVSKDSSAAAIIFEQAIHNSDEEIFREIASDIALERGEITVASSHINSLSDGINKTKRLARIARISGNIGLATELDLKIFNQLNPIEKVKAQITETVRLHDDRLPGKMPPDLINNLKKKIKSIDISSLPIENRNVALLSINLLQYSIALETQDLHSAAVYRGFLESQLGYDNKKLKIIDLKSRLAIKINDNVSPKVMEDARSEIDKSSNLLNKLSLIHIILEASGPKYPEWIIQLHSEISEEHLREDIATYRRLSAQKWYWKGILEPEKKLSHWREALDKFKSAECSNAASELLKLISNLI